MRDRIPEIIEAKGGKCKTAILSDEDYMKMIYQKLDEELFGSAASDYVRAAEIDKRKNEIDDELLELYELVM